jgi:hypothetical protein
MPLSTCGCGLGAATPGYTIDASEAMMLILRQYAALSAQGERLRQILLARGTVPCQIWDAYNQACLDYLAKSTSVFDQLTAKDVVVDQVIYSAGKPVPDPNNASQYRTLRVAAPLRPPGFGFTATDCPGIATFQGADAVAGWVPVPIEMGAVSSSVLSALGSGVVFLLSSTMGIALGFAGYEGFKTFKQIAIWIEDYYAQPARMVAAYTNCFERSVKSGLTPERASATCSSVQASAQASTLAQLKAKLAADGWGFWTWVTIGGGVLVAGGLLAFYLRSRLIGAFAGTDLEIVTNHPPVRPRRRRKTRRGRNPLLLGNSRA